MAVNWGLGFNMPDAGQAFSKGWEQGQQRRAEMETDNALRALVANPNDPNVVNALARHDPRAAMQIQGQQQKRQAEAQRQQILQRAYQGDKQAMSEAFGFDPDLVMKLDDNTKGQIKQSIDFISNAAQQIDRLPEEQRGQAWAQYVQTAESRGMDIPPEYEQYSPQVLQSAVAEAGAMSKLLEARDPRYQVIPEGGTLVNTRDPAALAQIAGGGQPAPTQGTPPANPQPNNPQVVAQAEQKFADAMRTKIITPEDVAVIRNGFGPGPESARRVQTMLDEAGIQVGRQIGGKTYVQRNGEWYEAGGNQ